MMINKIKSTVASYFIIAVLAGLIPSLSMASEQDKVNVAKALYAAFNQGDMPKILSLFSQDVVFVFYGPEDVLPQAGTFKGHQGIAQFFAEVDRHFDILEIGQRLFSVQGDVVSVLGWERAVSKATGGQYVANWVHVITVKNGVITHFEEVTDSAAIAAAITPADANRGKAYYTTCLGCHGLNGEGMWSMHAPRLTLQRSDYLFRQLRHFRQSVRGGVQDFYGWQMNGRAMALPNDRAIRDVVAYIDTLPDTVANDSVDGSVRKGKAIYTASCASCHGNKGEGNALLNSPRLAGLDGWYQLEQLNKFSSGLRGAHADDVIGHSMRAAVGALNDEQAMKDVVSYILSIKH